MIGGAPRPPAGCLTIPRRHARGSGLVLNPISSDVFKHAVPDYKLLPLSCAIATGILLSFDPLPLTG
jgi:hypothetical protein